MNIRNIYYFLSLSYFFIIFHLFIHLLFFSKKLNLLKSNHLYIYFNYLNFNYIINFEKFNSIPIKKNCSIQYYFCILSLTYL